MYHVSPEITCTVESYMGKRLSLSQINESQAHRYGWQIGNMVRMMNRKKTHIAGNGELAWDGANLYGTVPEQHPIITQKIEQSYNRNILLTLIEENLFPDQQIIRNKLDEAHAIRSVIEPTMLINRDITPENLTVQSDGRIGIIDPYPYLGNGTRFAAWFIHCYRFLLSTYAQTKRHHHNHYHRHEEKLNLIADGFERGYIQGNTELAQHIAAERWLWTLEQAYDDHKRLQQTDIPEHHIIKHGDSTIVKKRMSQAIHILETLEF